MRPVEDFLDEHNATDAFRAAVELGDLSGVDLSSDPSASIARCLASLPAGLLATGAEWAGQKEWGDTLRGGSEHVLLVCGVPWWSGDTELHGLAWSVGIRRSVLHMWENSYPDEPRPRQSIEALERWVESPTPELESELRLAQRAARGAALGVGRAPGWVAAADAAFSASEDWASVAAVRASVALALAARDVARDEAISSANTVRSAPTYAEVVAAGEDALASVGKATWREYELDWMHYMLERGRAS